jgi:hypothetical protein
MSKELVLVSQQLDEVLRFPEPLPSVIYIYIYIQGERG